ncbi:MAG: trehalose-6-phosphate synthase [Candidatus Taylorbacteria bacterium]|nr:trehalose-6-phosphate synthase [Candidatus Taylorbacteria bacterium]
MKNIIFTTLGAIVAVSIIVFGFTYTQVNQERLNLSADLQYRTRLLSDTLKESIEPSYSRNSTSTLQRIVDKFADKERIIGLGVFNNRGVPLASSKDMPKRVTDNPDFVFVALDKGSASGLFEKIDGAPRYLFVSPLYNNSTIVGALVTVQNASYIDEAITDIWKRNAVRLLVQVLVFSVAIVLLVRFVLYRISKRFADSVKTARMDKTGAPAFRGPFFLKPIASEIAKMHTSLAQARQAASLEARMRLDKLDSPWTAERLKEFVKVHVKGHQIYVVSNREPYVHTRMKNKITYSTPAHGMVTAVESVMEACGGLWIAHGSGNADKETADKLGEIRVPPEEPKYTLKRIWLTEEEVQGHYIGFSNEALFPLCLMSHTRPVFRKEDWEIYKSVNEKFAESLLQEITGVPEPIVLVQDLHFALVPKLIKAKRPDAKVGLFWHHPWPSAEQFSICPWRKEILEGMLGADIIGFHIQQHCNNFLDTVGKEIESIINFERFSVQHGGSTAVIRPFPVSVALTGDTAVAEPKKAGTLVLKELGIQTGFLGLGVDRLDYTKGILERLRGIEYFLDTYKEYREGFTFLQIAAPSREGVQKYREYGADVAREVERINQKFQIKDWRPIVFERRHYSHEELEPLYRVADICLVTSLHDGMNLVSKEFIATRADEKGVLILSQFAGASRDLREALIVNPYSAEEVGEAIRTGLEMPSREQQERMKALRTSVKEYNVYRWAAEFIKAVVSIR